MLLHHVALIRLMVALRWHWHVASGTGSACCVLAAAGAARLPPFERSFRAALTAQSSRNRDRVVPCVAAGLARDGGGTNGSQCGVGGRALLSGHGER
eukprot:COSAG02_NODE_1157_length_14186_cov_11.986299_2_plen_97_part_00